jgi:hypothetical protein
VDLGFTDQLGEHAAGPECHERTEHGVLHDACQELREAADHRLKRGWEPNLGIAMLPMEPGSLVMERRMLREIKRLSERLAAQAGDRTTRDQTQDAGA